MSTVTYNYPPGSSVYHVTEFYGIRPGVVKTIDITLKVAIETIKYTIALSDARDGIVEANEPDLFDDVDLALAYYKATYLV